MNELGIMMTEPQTKSLSWLQCPTCSHVLWDVPSVWERYENPIT